MKLSSYQTIKYKHLIIAIAVMAIACVKAETYNVSGTWKEGEGQWVYINIEGQGENRRVENIDSALVINGKFQMTGPFTGIKEVVFRAGRAGTMFILEKTPIIITCSMVETNRRGRDTTELQVKIEGSIEQSIYKTFMEAWVNDQILTIRMAFAGGIERDADPETLDSVGRNFLKQVERVQFVYDSLITNNPNTMMAAFIIDRMSNDWGLEKVEKMYSKLTPDIKASMFGKNVQTTIEVMKNVAQGAWAPDFTLITSDNTPVSLSDYKGKYVLLDFWGSWCAPCIRTHPKLVELHAKYGNRNFDILGLASERDTEGVRWKGAIERGGLTWRQVNLATNETGQDVLKNYNVFAFPTKILINPEGRIITTYVGPSDGLINQLAEIFGN